MGEFNCTADVPFSMSTCVLFSLDFGFVCFRCRFQDLWRCDSINSPNPSGPVEPADISNNISLSIQEYDMTDRTDTE